MNTKLLRLILAAILATTALAACRFSGEVDITVPPSDLVVTTNWEIRHNDGTLDRYVLCDNRPSQISSSFTVSSSSQVDRVVVNRFGEIQGEGDVVTYTGSQLSRVGNRVSLPTMGFSPGSTPFGLMDVDGDLEPQAIVIVPSDPAQRQGYLRLHYTVHMTSGAAFTFNPPVRIEVWGGCADA